MTTIPFGVREVRIQGFRSAREVSFRPLSTCALVGGPSVGKSNVLEAVWMLLGRAGSGPSPRDATQGAKEPIELSAAMAGGDVVSLSTQPTGAAQSRGEPVPVLFAPAALRSTTLVAAGRDGLAQRIARTYFDIERVGSSAAAASVLVDGVHRLVAAGERGLVLLIEEPELFLRPQAQRYLYRALRAFAQSGNQVLYSTHAPAFLNVARLEELALVEHSPRRGTSVIQPEPLSAGETFRALSEVDAERAELFLASAVLLVEGRSEKLSLPFVFHAVGFDPDREAITIIDCGGKPNIPLFIRICQAVRRPCVVIHDRDAMPGRRPRHAERLLNDEIRRLAGPSATFELAPDLEGVSGLHSSHHKPEHAWQQYSGMRAADVPPGLRGAVEHVVALARR